MWQRWKWTQLDCFGWLILLAIITTTYKVHAADVANPVQPSVENGQSSPDLKVLLQKFETKYKATLMSNTYASFVSECITNGNVKPVNLCSTYFDMIYNIFELRGFETAEEIERTTRDFDNTSIAEQFCELFPGEVATELVKRPFSDALGSKTSNRHEKDICVQNCVQFAGEETKIKQICKLISGGCRFINLNKLNKNAVNEVSKANALLPQPNGAKETINIEPKKNDLPPKEPQKKANAPDADKELSGKANPEDKLTNGDKKSPELPAKEGEANKDIGAQDNMNNDGQSNGEADQNEDAANEVPDDQKEAEKEDVDDMDAGGNDEKQPDELPIANDHREQTRFDSQNSNSIRSQLSANLNGFRADPTDSSFFSYFMFLMLVIISLYVAYHNKSKILALLIEGPNPSRSARNGSRRKGYSAEYRKLDSNLEEAIQSDGGKVLSTQIIY